jgi:hypothetical protein
MLHRIKPEDVREGMYIRGFGGSWFDHPFLRSKFVVRTKRDLERIHRARARYVVIDDERGCGPAVVPDVTPIAPAPMPSIKLRKPTAVRAAAPWNESEEAREKSDRQRARALVSRAMGVLRNAFADVRLGRAVRMDEVAALVDDVIGTVERSPRTLLEVLRLKQKDEYTYMHSVAVCTLMVNVARQLGKSETEMRDYGLAGLLHDLGKMGIPDAILNKAGRLTDALSDSSQLRKRPRNGARRVPASP